MKSKYIIGLLLAALPAALFGTATISGAALRNVTGVAGGDFAVLLVDTSGSGFNAAGLSSLGAGLDLTSSGTYSGFEVLSTTTASFSFGSTTAEFSIIGFDVLSAPILAGDAFGILTFTGGSTTSVASTSYEIWTDASWDIPADGASESFNTAQLAQLDSVSAGASGTVVPEPSAYAMLSGLLALSWVMVRRRA